MGQRSTLRITLSFLNKDVTIYTFPINYAMYTGLPCRVLAEV